MHAQAVGPPVRCRSPAGNPAKSTALPCRLESRPMWSWKMGTEPVSCCDKKCMGMCGRLRA